MKISIATEDRKIVSFSKIDILESFKSFDNREPDKTMQLWEKMADWLYKSDELKPNPMDKEHKEAIDHIVEDLDNEITGQY